MDVCAYEPCTCEIDVRVEHCGPTCRQGIGDVDEACKCGHAPCTASDGNASIRPS